MFHEQREIPHFSRFVSMEEIADKNFNLNIRHYVDQAPADRARLSTQALITGGVPRADVEAQRHRFLAFGIGVFNLFVPGGRSIVEFPHLDLQTVVERLVKQAATGEDLFLDNLSDWLAAERSEPHTRTTPPKRFLVIFRSTA